jgi:hypothetical protein
VADRDDTGKSGLAIGAVHRIGTIPVIFAAGQ